MTDEAKKDLLAVMDQLAECRRRHGMGYVSMFILADGFGRASEFIGELETENVIKQYEPAGGNRTGSEN